jgi:hypothetical protein
MPPPARPGGNRLLVIILVVAGALALLCCAGATVTGVIVWRTVGRDVGPARSATNAYLDDLQQGDTAAAYDRLCNQLKQSFSEPEYDAIVREKGLPSAHKLTSTSVHNDNGQRTAEVTARLNVSGGTRTHEFTLVREDGVWRICGEPY